MALNKKKAHKNLKKKGFTDSENRSGDHLYMDFIHEGKFALYTKISHGSTKDIGKPLIAQMATQCKLSANEFKDLVNCPLSKERYVKILKEKNVL